MVPLDDIEVWPHTISRKYCYSHSLRFWLVSRRSSRFDDILRLRGLAYGLPRLQRPDEFDEYSDHYVCEAANRPVATMRVTRASQGTLECEDQFPNALLASRRYQISSGTRFATDSTTSIPHKVAALLTEVVRLHQVSLGIRIDVIDVHERAVKYYGRLGYELVADSFFVHYLFKTPSRVMILPVSPGTASPMSHVFDEVQDPVSILDLGSYFDVQPWRSFKSGNSAVMSTQ